GVGRAYPATGRTSPDVHTAKGWGTLASPTPQGALNGCPDEVWAPGSDSVIASAGLDGPDCLDALSAAGDALAVEVHRGAAVGRQPLAAFAHTGAGALVLHLGVFLGQEEYLLAGVAPDDGLAEVLRDGLAPRIQDVP